ncbi:Phospholipase B1, membrane-associated [Trachymyrmex septentrionalis]|uniref:Phospholipase B1, membrane-associated n=1 Tax=Trachymyrmex septentrionalis TaxID=34720 RepID=A0A195FIP4_9HYME|nr:Phospholipase B1, membrane-associated [Trachymyrmex septentrionalis]
MWKWCQFYCILLIHISVLATERKTALDSPFNIMLLRAFRNWSFDAFGRTGMEEKYLQIARQRNKMQKRIPNYVPFPCNVTDSRSPEVPESVHKLRPGDIDVIAAMGDSLTAGAGIFADNEFNPNLIGFALGDSLTTHKESQLNIAESGAESADMMYMAEMLVKKIKNDPRINVQKHWKLISLMIGANDFCNEICSVSSPWSILENHKVDLLQVLRILRDNLPRTFVALIPPPHLKSLVDIRKEKSSFKCFVTTDVECSCLFGLAFQRYISIYYDIMRQWQILDMEIADYPEFQRNDFVVVAQPTLMNISIPLDSDGYSDMTYLSSDCFHVSQKTNARFANGLWNNLLETVGAKSMTWIEPFHKFHCPTLERPYLATALNSK